MTSAVMLLDRTVSRRSKPSSRTTLDGEQPYPWNLLQLQDVMSRHRGRNLPDKEFRYLRTVMVTAAVYWDLNSELHYKTPPHNLTAPGRILCFNKQSLSPIRATPEN
ncbi:hypothetical protein Lal_00003787 [Lupinus albus]|nr:hypothetical protein Lal_00003787 [Lupinus albus]